MIVTVNKPSFDYDIHSLVKAFYPYEDVSVKVCEDTIETPDIKIVFEIERSSNEKAVNSNEWDKDCRKINVFIRKNEEKNTENKTTADQVNEKRCDQESDYSLESVEFEALTRPDLKNKLKQLLYYINVVF